MSWFKNYDMRVNLALALISSLAIMVTRTEAAFAIMMAVSLAWLVLQSKMMQALGFVCIYGGLYGFSVVVIGIDQLMTLWIFANIARHLLIPIAFLNGVTDRPTGTVLAVFSELRIPKGMSIATVVLLRFLPTISHEYYFIRNSLKFRGIGASIPSTIAHLPRYFERIIVPLLIRTARISEELSAAAIVRGTRLDKNIVSFDPVVFRRSDGLLIGLFGSLIATAAIFDMLRVFG